MDMPYFIITIIIISIFIIVIIIKGIRSGTCHVIHWYAKANDIKYMKDYHKNEES